MEEVTRQDLIEWFGTDKSIDENTLYDLNRELNDAREQVFEHYGFRL